MDIGICNGLLQPLVLLVVVVSTPPGGYWNRRLTSFENLNHSNAYPLYLSPTHGSRPDWSMRANSESNKQSPLNVPANGRLLRGRAPGGEERSPPLVCGCSRTRYY